MGDNGCHALARQAFHPWFDARAFHPLRHQIAWTGIENLRTPTPGNPREQTRFSSHSILGKGVGNRDLDRDRATTLTSATTPNDRRSTRPNEVTQDPTGLERRTVESACVRQLA